MRRTCVRIRTFRPCQFNITRKMKKLNISLPLSVLLLFSSCTGNAPTYELPVFPEETEATFEFIGEELTFSPSDIDIIEDYIVATGFERVTENTLFVFDKNSGRLLKKGIRKGRGPAETLAGNREMTVHGDSVVLHDFLDKTRMAIPIMDFLSEDYTSVRKTECALKAWNSFFTDTPDGRPVIIQSKGYLSQDTIPVRSIVVRNPDGGDSSYDVDPIQDPKRTFVSSVYTRAAFSPESDKMALIPSLHFVLEIFDIRNGIRNIATKYFTAPDYEVDGGSFRPSDNLIFGARDIYADSNVIYVVYDGVKTWKDKYSSRYQKVALFSWKGKPVKVYLTNAGIHRICYDTVSGCIYALVETEESGYRLGRLRI